jgi:D-alanyl-D-alanine-carboxypeptidase/D-alanyl-D-alanine-endopeptidase
MAPRLLVLRNSLLISVLLLSVAVVCSAQTLPERLATSKEIQDMLAQRIDVQHKNVGIVVGVINKRGREIIAYGHFDASDPRVPDGDTVFEIGSISKVFTSLLLADMVLKGEVKLDDPISKYLPASVHAPTRNGKQITLLDLATHYSGLPRMPNSWNWDYSPEQMFEFLNHYELTRDPGQKYEYSNLAVGLLGQLLALRAGTDYETLLRTRVTDPLQMHSTAVHLTPEMKTNFTPGHGTGLKIAHPWEIPALAPAGGIRSTANDLLIFLAANMGIIRTPLEPAMKKMLSVHRPVSPGVQIALGWHIQNGVICHNGQTNGYNTFMGYDPRRKVGVVVLSNANQSIDDIGWRTFRFPVPGLTEQQTDIPNLHP